MPLTKHDKAIAKYYMESLPLKDHLPINKDMHSANETTMVSLLGSPKLPLTTKCQSSKASDSVKALKTTEKISGNFSLTGIKPAVDSAADVLNRVFAQEGNLKLVLSTQGMLCVRYRKPTSGKPSTKISNHSWGTAIDFNILGYDAPGNTGSKIPRFIAIMLPFFNAAGWYSGIAFHDTMHFEASEETIRKWSKDGSL